MSNREFETVILGGGCIGSSVASALCSRGSRDVALLDQGRKTVAATAQSGGMLRVFHEDPRHVELALSHHLLLKAHLDRSVFSDVLHLTGHLYFYDRSRHSHFQSSLRLMENSGYPFEILTSPQIQSRFPDFKCSENEWAIYEPQAGWMNPNRYSDDLLDYSVHRGLTLIEPFEALKIYSCRSHYRISGAQSTVLARSLILAGGARQLPLLQDLGLSLQLESRTITAYVYDNPRYSGSPDGNLGFPSYFDRERLEFGRLGPSRRILLSHPATLRLGERSWESPLAIKQGVDCYAPGRWGTLGQLPGHPQLFLATGWGGTAFKFSLEVGERIAQAVTREYYESRGSYAYI